VGVAVERDTSPPHVLEEAQQQTDAMEPQVSVEEVRDPPSAAAMAIEQPEKRVEEPPVEARATSESGIVDIACILGAPTIICRVVYFVSSLHS
jgi:hypothetical protein